MGKLRINRRVSPSFTVTALVAMASVVSFSSYPYLSRAAKWGCPIPALSRIVGDMNAPHGRRRQPELTGTHEVSQSRGLFGSTDCRRIMQTTRRGAGIAVAVGIMVGGGLAGCSSSDDVANSSHDHTSVARRQPSRRLILPRTRVHRSQRQGPRRTTRIPVSIRRRPAVIVARSAVRRMEQPSNNRAVLRGTAQHRHEPLRMGRQLPGPAVTQQVGPQPRPHQAGRYFRAPAATSCASSAGWMTMAAMSISTPGGATKTGAHIWASKREMTP